MIQKQQIKKGRRQKSQKHGNKLRIIPLGGQEEVGRNMTVFEYGGDIVILDMGIQFPEEDMPGIDYIIPNISYLKGKENRIRGVIFTHGHLDHIGAAPILLEKLQNPTIIGRPLTLSLIRNRVEDYKKGTAKRLHSITVKSVKDKFKLGVFTIGFFPVDHSIMDAVGVTLQTPQGTVIHPGDWTYEKDPVGRLRTEYHQRQAPGRIIIGTFSSQIERTKQLIEYAQKIGKKVALDGYSMKINVEVAKQLCYIQAKKSTLITVDQIHKYPDRRVIVICTGAQGEPRAVLSRIVNGNHRFIKVKKNDTIVFSSSVIPGNERTIQRLKDNLYRLSDNVIHTDIMDVHSGGHSNRDDILEVIRQIRPTYFLPVYANHYFLKEAEKLAVRHGFPKDRIFVLDNGSIIEFSGDKANLLPKKVPSHYVFVDGLGVGDVSHVVLRDRQMLATDGMFVVIVTIDSKTGDLTDDPYIISRGFVYMKQSRKLLDQVRDKVKKILKDGEPRAKADEQYIKNKIRDQIGQFLFSKTERRPMVLPVVIEV